MTEQQIYKIKGVFYGQATDEVNEVAFAKELYNRNFVSA